MMMKKALTAPFLLWQFLSRLCYQTVIKLASKCGTFWVMIGVAFFGSFVFPIPADAFLIPMVLSIPQRAWKLAAFCTLASVLGGFCGYAIGLFLYDTVGIKLLNFYGYMNQFEQFKALYHEWGLLIVMVSGITPFPYKVVTITSGVVELNFLTFALASVVSRGIRFFTVAGLLWKFGLPIKKIIEKHFSLTALFFLILLIGGFVVLSLF